MARNFEDLLSSGIISTCEGGSFKCDLDNVELCSVKEVIFHLSGLQHDCIIPCSLAPKHLQQLAVKFVTEWEGEFSKREGISDIVHHSDLWSLVEPKLYDDSYAGFSCKQCGLLLVNVLELLYHLNCNLEGNLQPCSEVAEETKNVAEEYLSKLKESCDFQQKKRRKIAGENEAMWNLVIPKLDGAKKVGFRCRYCYRELAGTISRVKSHLAKIKSRHISACEGNVPDDIMQQACAAVENFQSGVVDKFGNTSAQNMKLKTPRSSIFGDIEVMFGAYPECTDALMVVGMLYKTEKAGDNDCLILLSWTPRGLFFVKKFPGIPSAIEPNLLSEKVKFPATLKRDNLLLAMTSTSSISSFSLNIFLEEGQSGSSRTILETNCSIYSVIVAILRVAEMFDKTLDLFEVVFVYLKIKMHIPSDEGDDVQCTPPCFPRLSDESKLKKIADVVSKFWMVKCIIRMHESLTVSFIDGLAGDVDGYKNFVEQTIRIDKFWDCGDLLVRCLEPLLELFTVITSGAATIGIYHRALVNAKKKIKDIDMADKGYSSLEYGQILKGLEESTVCPIYKVAALLDPTWDHSDLEGEIMLVRDFVCDADKDMVDGELKEFLKICLLNDHSHPVLFWQRDVSFPLLRKYATVLVSLPCQGNFFSNLDTKTIVADGPKNKETTKLLIARNHMWQTKINSPVLYDQTSGLRYFVETFKSEHEFDYFVEKIRSQEFLV